MTAIGELFDSVYRGDIGRIPDLVAQALSEGISPECIIRDAFLPAMDQVGTQFSEKKIYIPEMLVAAKAMNTGLDILKPLLRNDQAKCKAKIVLGTVKGDLHDIGKNLVRIMMEGSGMEVIDLGVDVPAHRFLEACRQYTPQIIALSALLTTTMPEMAIVIKAFEDEGARAKVKIMVGGAPVTSEFAKDIGADGYGNDAAEAVFMVRRLLQQ